MQRSKIRVASYLRVSADTSGKAKSVTDQGVEYAEDLADNPMWTEVGRYVDNSLSASRYARKSRKEFDRLVADIEAGQIDLVWLWEVSRQSRDMVTFVPLRELCRRLRLKWYVHSEERLYDFAKASDVRDLTRSMVDAEAESEKTSERVQRGLRANLRNGVPHAHVPFGYRRTYSPVTGDFESQYEYPPEAAIVREIAARFASGESVNAIVVDLNARGVDSPSTSKRRAKARNGEPVTVTMWTPITVKSIATSPVYIGKRTYKKGRQCHPDGTPFDLIHDGNWPPLLDLLTHEQCIQRTQLPPDRRWARTSRPVHLLTGILRCGVCGAITSIRNLPTGPVLVCKTGGCVRAPEELADEVAIATIAKWLARPKVAMAALVDTSPQRLRAAREEEAGARTEHRQAIALAKAGKLSVTALAELEPELLARVDRAEQAVARLSLPGSLAHLLKSTGDPRQRFLDLNMGMRRQVLNALYDMKLLPAGKGRRFRIEQVVLTPRKRPA